jgi:phosphate acetyltransferase/phosphate butyryltransferase
MERIENRTFDEIKLGDMASLVRTLTHKDIEPCRGTSIRPIWMTAFAKSDMFHKVVAHGMWSGALVSTVLGTQLPGSGTVYVDQSLHLRDRARARRRVDGSLRHHGTFLDQCRGQSRH